MFVNKSNFFVILHGSLQIQVSAVSLLNGFERTLCHRHEGIGLFAKTGCVLIPNALITHTNSFSFSSGSQKGTTNLYRCNLRLLRSSGKENEIHRFESPQILKLENVNSSGL